MNPGAQTQALQTINQLMSIAGQLLGLCYQIQVIDAAWNDDAIATTIAALGTIALNADGSLGAADSSPVTTHPINPNTYPTILRLISSTQITQIKTVLDNLPNWIISGEAVASVGNASNRAILNVATGG